MGDALKDNFPEITRLRYLAKMPCPFGCGLPFGCGTSSVKHMWYWHMPMELSRIDVAARIGEARAEWMKRYGSTEIKQ